MIACPKCHASLPDWAQTCQFCQTDVTKVPRPVVAKKKPDMSNVPQWVWGAYYALAVFYIVEGVYEIVMAFVRSRQTFMGEEMGFGLMGTVSIIIGALTIAIGVGLLLRVEIIRGIVNFFCGLQILFGLLGLAGSLMGAIVSGPLGVLMAFMNVAQIAAAAFMIFLIGETDKAAPNI